MRKKSRGGLAGLVSWLLSDTPRASRKGGQRAAGKRNASKAHRPKKRNPDDLAAAQRLSEQFHGTPSQVVKLGPRERILPRYVTVAGQLDEFTYSPSTKSQRGYARWRHESGDRGFLRPKNKKKPLLAADPRTGEPIIVSRSGMKLTNRGYEG